MSWRDTIQRRNRRWKATADCPLRRVAAGHYVTLDGVYEIQRHYTHRMWFISFTSDEEGTSPHWASEWYETLWEARRDLAARSEVVRPEESKP